MGVATRREPRPSERRSDLRGRRAGRTALHCDALRTGPRPPGRCSAGRGPWRRSEPSRSPGRSRVHSMRLTAGDWCTATSSPATFCWIARTRGEHCYLADFGLTQSPSERGPTDGQFMGTVAYVSPEQIRGEAGGTAVPTSTAWRACSSSVLPGPFRTGTRSDVAVIFAHLEEPVPPASGRPVGASGRARPRPGARHGQGARRPLRELRRAGRSRR